MLNRDVGAAVGRWVVEGRTRLGWDQMTLHFEARIEQSRLSRIERGVTSPRPEEWAVFIAMFGEPPWGDFAKAARRTDSDAR